MVSAARIVAIGVLALIQGHPGFADPVKVQRPFEVDDMLMQEDVGRFFGGPYSLSSTGEALAFTRVRVLEPSDDPFGRVRATGSFSGPQLVDLLGNVGGDVWVQLTPGEPAVNITNGARDNSSWWAPQWNRDGHVLAMLSTRGGEVGIWVWDVNARQPRRVSQANFDLASAYERPFVWLDAEHLVYPTSASRGSDNETSATRAPRPTSSVLESGIPPDLTERNKGELILVDVLSRTETSLAQGRTRSWTPSPDGKYTGFVREASIRALVASVPLYDYYDNMWAVGIANTSGVPIALDSPACQFANRGTLRWSPDGGELAFLGYAQSQEKTVVLCRVDVATHTVRSFPLSGVDTSHLSRYTPPFEWSNSRDLILIAPKLSAHGMAALTGPLALPGRQDWWTISSNGVVKSVTEGIPTPPGQLWVRDDRQVFVGIADGRLWKMSTSNRSMENLTPKSAPTIDRIVWPMLCCSDGTEPANQRGGTYSEIVVSARDRQRAALYLVDLHTGSFRPIQAPTPEANLVAYSAVGHTAVFLQRDKAGLFLWRTHLPDGSAHEVFKTNEFLRDIEEAPTRSLEYTSLNGKKLSASLVLPIGYRAGIRYPTITWVYAGARCPGIGMDIINNVSTRYGLNYQIPAAKGYAVLVPCMPLEEDGTADEPMLRLLDGVIPAVDKAIDLGIADADHLFLLGKSFGGFSTYGIVTQTQRFKAAAAFAGPSDLISLYGQFAALDRYTDRPQENHLQQVFMESGQTRMGNPPWKDLGRYLRNSPIFYVERVQTPLLIVQGDLDFVGIEQGEEFFTALYRQGKRAEFVRYWGEGHTIQQPDNVRDMWKRIFAWFESNATGAVPSASKPADGRPIP
jgi:hypothetical protein